MSRTRQSLGSQPGQVFSEFNIAADRETIIRQYEENGFPNATFEWSSKPGTRPHTFDLTFVINEGQQQFVREVVISGLATTRPGLVDKQLELKPGSPLSLTAMANIQRKLYDLGIFSQVDMAIQNPDGEENNKYVLYNLDEARRYSLTTGFGLQFARIGGSNTITDLSDPGGAPGISPRFSLAISRLNLFGAGQTVTAQGVVSTLQRRALVNYFVPKIFNQRKLDANFSLLYDDTFDVNTFQSKREEATVKLTHHVSKPVTISYNFTYRHVGISNLKIDPLLLPQLAQAVRVGIAEVNIIQDRRDDPLDAHRGIYNTFDVGLAAKCVRFPDQFRAHPGEECDVPSARVEAGLRARNATGIAAGVGDSSQLGTGGRDSAGGAFLRGRGKYTARIPRESGGAARYGDRLPAGRVGDVFQQHGTAVPALWRQHRWRSVRGYGECVFEHRGDNVPDTPAK